MVQGGAQDRSEGTQFAGGGAAGRSGGGKGDSPVASCPPSCGQAALEGTTLARWPRQQRTPAGAPGFEWCVRKDQRPVRPNVGDTWLLPGNHMEDVHASGGWGAGLAMNAAGTSVLASPGVSRRGPLARPPTPQSGMPRGGEEVGKEGDTGSREHLEQCSAHTSS